jgi:hypothetical protein
MRDKFAPKLLSLKDLRKVSLRQVSLGEEEKM